MKILNLLGRRVLTLYIVIFLLSTVTVNYRKVKGRAMAATLSRLMPSFEYLINFQKEQHGQFDAKHLKDYVLYYEELAGYLPSREEVYGMLGFFSYQSGKQRQAVEYYKRAVQLNLHFFWFTYDLGVIYFNNGQYKTALEILRRAMATSSTAQYNIDFLNTSKVFLPIVVQTYQLNPVKEGDLDPIAVKLTDGYRDCLILLILSSYHLGDFSGMLNYAKEAIASAIYAQDFFYYYAGLAAYKMKSTPEAIHFFQECIQRNPESVDAYYYLGLSLKELGQEKVSLQALKRAADLHAQGKPHVSLEARMDVKVF